MPHFGVKLHFGRYEGIICRNFNIHYKGSTGVWGIALHTHTFSCTYSQVREHNLGRRGSKKSTHRNGIYDIPVQLLNPSSVLESHQLLLLCSQTARYTTHTTCHRISTMRESKYQHASGARWTCDASILGRFNFLELLVQSSRGIPVSPPPTHTGSDCRTSSIVQAHKRQAQRTNSSDANQPARTHIFDGHNPQTYSRHSRNHGESIVQRT
jgi:hypothetical protein